MKRLAPSRPALFGILGAVALLAVWYQLLWTPQGAAIASAHQREQSATAALFTAEQRLGHLKRLAKNAQQLQALGTTVSAAVPADDQIDGFLISLNDEARTAGVTIANIGLPSAGAVPAAGTSAIPVSLSVTGGYFSIRRFLANLREGSRLFVVNTVSLAATSSSGGGPAPASDGTLLSASIVGQIFTSKVASVGVTSIAAPAGGGSHTGVLETPINAAKATASAASATTTAHGGGTP